MRNIFSYLLCFLVGSSIFAQDNITLKNGEVVKSKVLEITTAEIKYKRFDNQEGPTYTLPKSEVVIINYENGSKDVFEEQTTDPTAISTLKGNTDSSLIIIYRAKNFAGSAVSYNLYADDILITRIKNGSYFEFMYPAGEVEFWAKTEAKESLKTKLEAGKTYYLECSVRFGAFVGRPNLIFADKFTAEQKIVNLNKSKSVQSEELSINENSANNTVTNQIQDVSVQNDKKISAKEKSQKPFIVSAYFIGGKGFNSTDINISGGGGIGFDAELGYDFFKSFGITADIGWQKSLGTDASINADIDFTRWQVLLTPKLLIPINTKNQINLGAGPGLYFNGYTFIYASNAESAAISYSPAFGFHALVEYKYHLNKWLAIGLGAKLTLVTYKADWVSDDIPVSSLKDEYKNFKGNGLDGYVGLSINF